MAVPLLGGWSSWLHIPVIVDPSSSAVKRKTSSPPKKLHIPSPGMLIDHRGILEAMSHTIRKKKKLAHRVARIRGQVEALARALDGEAECGDVLRLIASARGAMDSLMAEVIEGHIRDHAFRGVQAKSDEGQAAEDLVDIIRSYLK